MKLKKLAIFVEGQTEQIFLKEFIEQIAGKGNISFECKAVGAILNLKQKDQSYGELHKVLIFDCQGDGALKSTILDRRDGLISAGYTLILGLRDLYPISLEKLEAVKLSLTYGIPTAGVPTKILLAVFEIEAWFLQENLHYSKIDQNLDVSTFKSSFDFDPTIDSAEKIKAPAALLQKIYRSVRKGYNKNRTHVDRTVKAIDYENLYINCTDKLLHLKEFVVHLENFLAPDFA